MSKVLVTVETVKIKDFIFSTNRLKLIRGASYLLDFMNQVRVPEILEKIKFQHEDEKNLIEVLYIGAGNAKFLVNDGKAAEKIRSEILKAYKDEAPGSKVVIEIVPAGEKISEAIGEAAKKIAIAKSIGFKTVNNDIPFIEKCELCCTNPAEFALKDLEEISHTSKAAEEEYRVMRGQLTDNLLKDSKSSKFCNECLQKLRYSNRIKSDEAEIGFYSTFRNRFQREFNDYIPAESLEKYVDFKNFIGLMYSDGDGLGDFLAGVASQVRDNDRYIEFMGEFSRKLDSATKESLIKVIEDMREKFETDENGKRFYGEFLIVGGDDVCAIFPSKLTAEISYKFQKEFEKTMLEFKRELEIKFNISSLENITSSSGVIIAKAKTPAHYLFDKGIELQKLAKKKRYQYFNTPKNRGEIKTGYIDFQVIGSEGCADISRFRESLGNTYENPYSLADYQKFTDFIGELKAIGFPKTKIRYIYETIRDRNTPDFEKKMRLLDILSKMSERDIAFLVKKWNFNFREVGLLDNFSNIFSVLEMYDFIGGDSYED